MTLTVGRAFHIQLHYHVLSHLDLGRDAANLFQSRASFPSWVSFLQRAYLMNRKGSGLLQHDPLCVRDLEGLYRRLEARDERAATLMLQAMVAEQEQQEKAWEQDAAQARQQIDAFVQHHGDALLLLRRMLWERRGLEPPPLYVFDAPALGTHGRGMGGRTYRCCAVSLARDGEQALCQVFHEEVHAISDEEVEKASGQSLDTRDTQVRSDGFRLHQALEHRAVELGGELIQEHTPMYQAAYQQWRERFGV
ncbi:MAG: hypothetical protein EP343_25290 [Deltaproteobacteria bacterium]|nr:MAG: hypothetical protein EP343_25290 [Deltaproteobacteria bacterium]